MENGFKGCVAFDCFGAGQKVAQVSFGGHDWREVPKSARQMFEVFQIMRQLHELLWYLDEALLLQPVRCIHDKIKSMFDKIEHLTHLNPDSIMELDVPEHRAEVNTLLLKTSEIMRADALSGQKSPFGRRKSFKRGADLAAADLRENDLQGAYFRGACLIAADLRGTDLSGTDFIGADLRDTDLRGADLTRSIFLTQTQLNSAKGDTTTKIPTSLIRPAHWAKS
ncbi:MAG TPA: pentapeptide repeat-containing protein [Syntrophomonadaceae bacterium]|nr:pentapeptide repeat-containing protein [Syntrophomonadaceae bacterium]